MCIIRESDLDGGGEALLKSSKQNRHLTRLGVTEQGHPGLAR